MVVGTVAGSPVVRSAGFEPAIPGLKGRCPWPLDDERRGRVRQEPPVQMVGLVGPVYLAD